MKLRIRFASDVILEGSNIKEIISKWEKLPLHPSATGIEYVEIKSAERVDDNSYKDYTNKF